jgi:FOG: WD40 repeat
VLALGWSPDGAPLAPSGSRHCAIEIWNAVSGEFLNFFQSSKGDCIAAQEVAWSPDGLRIATCGIDSAAKVWSAETGALIGAFPGHTGGIYGLAWSPDGTRIASGGGDGSVYIWSPETDLL